jgi:hypothetical protein
MPSKTSKKQSAAVLPSILKELIDQMVSGPMDAEAVDAASMAFKKALIERILGAELSHHLGYPPGADKPDEVGNHRNGVSSKTVLTEDGPLRIDVPRYRQSSFEPLLDRSTLMGNLFQPRVNQPLKPRGFITHQIATKRPLANTQQKGRLPLGQTPRTPAVIGFFKSHLPELL